ncbi:MAG: OmpA family protein [Proteobacteria bacterium]|nr:OmpA family protein [Pseudomonadota bacterium]
MQKSSLHVLIAILVLITEAVHAQIPANPGTTQRPVVISGTVPDEATRQAILTKLRTVYGADRVIDQLGIGNVAAPPNWSEYAQRLISDDLKQISNGELDLNGNSLSVRGEVSNEDLRQQIPGQLASRLNPTYQVRNGLRVGHGEQQLLDKTLANRIVEFESGAATLTPRGIQLLDEMLAVISQLNNRQIQVIGHTDSSGRPESNAVLSQSRAEAVRQYFIQHGIAGEHLLAIGKGSQEPVASNTSSEGRARNRRIEFRIIN